MSTVLYVGNVGRCYSFGFHPNLKLKVVDLNVRKHKGTCQPECEGGSTYPVILTHLQMRTQRYCLSVTATATHHAHTGGSAGCWLFRDDRQVTGYTVRQVYELIFRSWICWKNTVSKSYILIYVLRQFWTRFCNLILFVLFVCFIIDLLHVLFFLFT